MFKEDHSRINQIIDLFLHNPARAEPIIRPASTWQGQSTYKDMNMIIHRNMDINLNIPDDINDLVDMCRPDVVWAEAHFQERIGGKPLNPGESYKVWPYANFDKNTEFQKDEKFDHSYMERFWPKFSNNCHLNPLTLTEDPNYPGYKPRRGIRFHLGDYSDVVNQLKENPLTRQAYLPIFFPEDTGAKDNMRVPCTLGYLFEIFDNKLDITYYIRSCDAYRHLRNDIYMACRLVQHTKGLLFLEGMKDIRVGSLYMKIANLHIFENDKYALNKKENNVRK